MHLFVYGTLINKKIMLKAAGCLPDSRPAILYGFKRMCIKGADYPGIVPAKSSAVNGLLYQNIPPFAWKRLDEYEGRIYKRQLVEVELDRSCFVEAYVYVVKREFYYLLEDKPWKGLDNFKRAQ